MINCCTLVIIIGKMKLKGKSAVISGKQHFFQGQLSVIASNHKSSRALQTHARTHISRVCALSRAISIDWNPSNRLSLEKYPIFIWSKRENNTILENSVLALVSHALITCQKEHGYQDIQKRRYYTHTYTHTHRAILRSYSHFCLFQTTL